jgi:AcrR family transcriptional regulator
MVTESYVSRRERKKSAIRSKIIATGIALFSKHGIADVTVEQIAEAADIGKGTIYNYFDTKEDVVVAFMVDIERKVQAQVPRIAKSSGDLSSILTEYLQFQFRMKKRYHHFVRVFLSQMFGATEQFIPYMVEMQRAIDPPLESLFRELQRRRMIRRDVSLSELILAFKTVQMGITCVWAIEGPPFTNTTKVLELQMQLFSKGLEVTRL